MPRIAPDEVLAELAPAGFYVALRVGFYAPEREIISFPPEWTDHYTRQGLALADPLLRWCHENNGAARWEDMRLGSDHPVLAAYRGHGLAFGASVSVHGAPSAPKRSFGIFARPDRGLRDSEMAELSRQLRRLHEGLDGVLTLPQAAALRLLAQGRRHKEIAAQLDISISAVKIRLRNAADRLGAGTPTEAASIAAAEGLL